MCVLTSSGAKRLGESGFEKSALGAKMLGERVAAECSVDASSGRASCSVVVSAGSGGAVGAKVEGAVGSSASGASVACGAKVGGAWGEVAGVWSSAGKKATVSWTVACGATTRVGAVWEASSWREMPRGAVGVATRLNEATEVRAKVSQAGVVSGALKATVNQKLSLAASAELDAAHLESGNHKLGLGLEFIF